MESTEITNLSKRSLSLATGELTVDAYILWPVKIFFLSYDRMPNPLFLSKFTTEVVNLLSKILVKIKLHVQCILQTHYMYILLVYKSITTFEFQYS